MKSGLEGRNNKMETLFIVEPLPRLNEVRPRRPEQWTLCHRSSAKRFVSMKSGLEGRNNPRVRRCMTETRQVVSMKSGLEGRNNDPQEDVYLVVSSMSQ